MLDLFTTNIWQSHNVQMGDVLFSVSSKTTGFYEGVGVSLGGGEYKKGGSGCYGLNSTFDILLYRYIWKYSHQLRRISCR